MPELPGDLTLGGLAKNQPHGHLGNLKSRLSNVRISLVGYAEKLLNTHISTPLCLNGDTNPQGQSRFQHVKVSKVEPLTSL